MIFHSSSYSSLSSLIRRRAPRPSSGPSTSSSSDTTPFHTPSSYMSYHPQSTYASTIYQVKNDSNNQRKHAWQSGHVITRKCF